MFNEGEIKNSGRGHVHVYYPRHAPTACALAIYFEKKITVIFLI